MWPSPYAFFVVNRAASADFRHLDIRLSWFGLGFDALRVPAVRSELHGSRDERCHAQVRSSVRARITCSLRATMCVLGNSAPMLCCRCCQYWWWWWRRRRRCCRENQNHTSMASSLFSCLLPPLAVAVSVFEEFIPTLSCVSRGTFFNLRRILTGMLLSASLPFVKTCDVGCDPGRALSFHDRAYSCASTGTGRDPVMKASCAAGIATTPEVLRRCIEAGNSMPVKMYRRSKQKNNRTS